LINAGLAYAQLRLYLSAEAPALEHQAAEVFMDAAAVAQTLHNAQAASYAWGHLGHLYEEAQRYPEALHLTQQAVFAAQQVQAPDALYRWQWQSGRLLQALHRREAAISAYQHAVETVQSLRDALPCAYGKRQSPFRTAFGPLFFGFVDLLLQRAAAAPESPQARADLEHARLTMEQFKKAEIQDYLGDVCVGASTARVTALEDVAATAVVVYPIPLPDRLELLVGMQGELRRFQVAVTADKLESVATGFRQAVQDGRRTYQQLAQALYTWLIRPFEAAMVSGGIQTVVFVPDGVLRTIPLAALHDGQQFLIEKYALVVTPGLHLTDPQPLMPDTLRVLAAGVAHAPGSTFADLPYVTEELQAIAQLFPGRVHQLEAFRLADLETAWQQERFTVLHIASHGVFAHDAAHSFLVTADGTHLTMERLAQLVGRMRVHKEPLALLTLSACDTALGDDRAALGLAGVAVQAGARSVLATLWQVQDKVTADLVTAFYTHLQQPGVSRAQALQQAQITLLTQGTAYTHHPYYWASFLLINNWL
jgi:CHAT domain-containing protein